MVKNIIGVMWDRGVAYGFANNDAAERYIRLVCKPICPDVEFSIIRTRSI